MDLTIWRRPFAEPDFVRLFASQLASEVGDWMARLALAVVVYDRTRSAGLTALVTALSLVPWAVGGPWLASLADYWPRRRVMVVCDLVRAAGFAALLWHLPIWVLLVVICVASAATPPFEAARSAVLVDAVPDDVYGTAAATAGITADLAIVAGYLVGGILVAAVGVQIALVINVLSFVVSALALAGLRAGRDQPHEQPPAPVRAAARVLRADPFIMRALLTAMAGTAGAVGALAVVVPYVAAYGSGSAAIVGVLAASTSAASALASVMIPHRGRPAYLLQVQATLVASSACVAVALFGFQPGFPLALVPYAAIGVIFASLVSAQPVIGLRLPAEIRSSAFGLLQAGLLAAQAVGAALCGVLAAGMGASHAAAVLLLPAGMFGIYAMLHPLPDIAPDPTTPSPADMDTDAAAS